MGHRPLAASRTRNASRFSTDRNASAGKEDSWKHSAQNFCRQRRRLGFTLDDLAGRTGISKPYLSLIETGRVPNPPSDEKLRRLE